MVISQISEFLQNIRRASLRRDEAGLTDDQLLEAYIQSREEEAFAALVQRHGPMVWGVCRRVLGNEGDAEDAFQATFLVLVRKAASIVPREQIANWLYGVARQIAVKARAMAVKRKTREKQVQDLPEPAVREQDRCDDVLALLDQELGRLSAKYRTAIVLCDLEGKSYKEASRQLGCPEGTLAARLTRGRAMLARRLARHGLAVTGGALAAVLSQCASASVPASVVSTTITAARLFAAGTAAASEAISVKAVALTEGVLKTMLLTKLKITTVVLFVASTAAFTCGALAMRQQPSPEGDVKAKPQTKPIESPKVDGDKLQGKHRQAAKDTKNDAKLAVEKADKTRLQALLKERVEILRRNVERAERLVKQGVAGLDTVYQARLRLYKAELDLCETTKERIAILEKIVDVYKQMEARLALLGNRAAASQEAIDEAKLTRLEAEIALDREKSKLVAESK